MCTQPSGCAKQHPALSAESAFRWRRTLCELRLLLFLLDLATEGWLRARSSALQVGQGTWIELLPTTTCHGSGNNGAHQFLRPWDVPQLQRALVFPNLLYVPLSLACAAVQLAPRWLAGGTAPGISVHLMCFFGGRGWAQWLPVLPSWMRPSNVS